MKLKAIFTLAIILILGLVIPSVNAQNLIVQSGQQLTQETVLPFINQQLKTTWWQYLRGANLLYHGSLDGADRVLFLLIHRNIVGTFLSVIQWVKGQKQIKVQTLVRLGNGYGDGSEAKYGPVQVDPKSYSFKLEEGEFFVDTNEKGQLQVNGQTVGGESNGSNGVQKTIDEAKVELNAKCVLLDSWIRENNWQYLRGASNVHRSGRITNERYYCVYNYVNVVGTFFVLASTDVKTGRDFSVDTFVKLGDGYQKESEALYKPVIFEPVTLQFDLLN